MALNRVQRPTRTTETPKQPQRSTAPKRTATPQKASPKKSGGTDRSSKLKQKIQNNQKRVKMGKGIFRDDVSVDFYTPKAGEHIVDIVPFDMGPDSPIFRGKPLTVEGDPDYVLDLWVHYGEGVGADQSVICLAQTFEKKCPICEHRQQLMADGETEKADQLKSKRRTIYNVVSYDSRADEAKGVQVWNVAFFYIEKHLLKLAKQPIRSGRTDIDPYINFASEFSDGKSISFEIDDKGEYAEYGGHKLLDRDYDLPQEVIEGAHQLDQLINIPEYEDVYQLHYMEEETTEGEEDFQVPEEDEVEETSVPARGRGRARQPEPVVEEEVQEDTEESQDEVVEDVQEEIEETPPPKPARRARMPKQKEPVVEDENPCIGEGTFGVDNGNLNECDECSVFDSCFEEGERLKSQDKPKTPRGRSRR
ncbi:MAG: hypothetical protein A2W22_00585 [Candidatus Levybacteria bacterium RBG_16_35_11]|nr:MAG: hypothetical protein A2W22_00585 [Candidatus Levybacteria bacterium RBG_16_35_11]